MVGRRKGWTRGLEKIIWGGGVGMPTERSYQTKTLSDDNSKRGKTKTNKTHWVGI